MKLLIATLNPGKLEEYKLIFKDLGLDIKLVSVKNLGIEEKPEETGKTFEENTIIKAKFYYKLTKIPTLADDGGIEIDYLKGEPGIRSRRWPGYEATDKELRDMTLGKLKGVPWAKRGAQLKVVIAIIPEKEKVYTFEEVWRGYIVENRSKTARLIPGYPFRSILYIPETKTILGELPFEEEARIGHRRKALEKALPLLKKELNI